MVIINICVLMMILYWCQISRVRQRSYGLPLSSTWTSQRHICTAKRLKKFYGSQFDWRWGTTKWNRICWRRKRMVTHQALSGVISSSALDAAFNPLPLNSQIGEQGCSIARNNVKVAKSFFFSDCQRRFMLVTCITINKRDDRLLWKEN